MVIKGRDEMHAIDNRAGLPEPGPEKEKEIVSL